MKNWQRLGMIASLGLALGGCGSKGGPKADIQSRIDNALASERLEDESSSNLELGKLAVPVERVQEGTKDSVAKIGDKKFVEGSKKQDLKKEEGIRFGGLKAGEKKLGKDKDKEENVLRDNVKFGQNGVELTTADGLSGIEYSEQYGYVLNVGVQMNPDNTQSFVLKGSIGEKEKRLLAGYGIKVGERGILSFMGEYYRQSREHTLEGTDENGSKITKKFDVDQAKVGVSLKIDSLEVGLSHSKSFDEDLGNTILIVDSEYLWQKYSVNSKFEGQSATNFYVSKIFDVSKNSDLRVALGLTDIDGKMYLDGGLKYSVYMGKNGRIFVSVSRRGETTSYSGGYEMNIGNSGLKGTISAQHIEGPDGYNDNVIGAFITVPFGKSGATNYEKPSNKYNDVNVASQLISSIDDFKSYQVLGEVKTNKKLLAEIDKNGIPANASIDKMSGDIVVGGLNPFTAFASITKNGSATGSRGFVIRGGNSVLIDISELSEPKSGIDTYVLTTNGNPANRITAIVAKGSIIIRSVVVETLNSVDTTKPVLTLVGSSTVNLTQGDTYTEQGATALDNVDGNITGNVVIGGDTVNTNVVGTYVVTYNVTDASGNIATQITRTVNVEALPVATSASITGTVPANQNTTYNNITLQGNTNFKAGTTVTVSGGSVTLGSISGDTITLSSITTPSSNDVYIYINQPGEPQISVRQILTPLNTAPVAQDVTIDGALNQFVIYDLSGNIIDTESADNLLTINVVSGPSHGSLSWSGTQFRYDITDGTGYWGDDSFTYYVSDPDGGVSAIKTVTITDVTDW